MQAKHAFILFVLIGLFQASCTPSLEPMVVERETRTPTATLSPTEIPPTQTIGPTIAPTFTPYLPYPTPTPLNPATDLNWSYYTSESLRFVMLYLSDWEIRIRDDIFVVTSPELQGDNATAWAYSVYVSEYPNPEDKPFPEAVAVSWNKEDANNFTYEEITYGSHTTYRTTSVPSAQGSLTVFIPGNGRFLAFSLTPFSTTEPDAQQVYYVQYFEAMLNNIWLFEDPIPFSTPTPPPFATPTPPPIASTQIPVLARDNNPLISADGRFVSFLSTARLTDNAERDTLSIFLRDTEIGTTTLLNTNLNGVSTRDNVYGYAISSDAQVLAYYSSDGEIVPDDEMDCGSEEYPASCEDLFIYDQRSGETVRIPLGRSQGLGADYTVAVTANGRFIAYGHQNNLWVYDRESGLATPQLTSINGDGPEAPVFAPMFAGDGRYLLFVSAGADLVPDDTNETYDVFLLDREAGSVERISTTAEGGNANNTSGAEPFHEGVGSSLAISADGRFVAFASMATNLTADSINQCDDYRGYTRPCYNIFLRDRETGKTLLITYNSNADSTQPTLSADGRYLAFASTVNLIDMNHPACDYGTLVTCGQIYLYDTALGEIKLVSRTNDDPGDGGSYQPALAENGRYLVFTSNASNLIPGEINTQPSIFRYDNETGLLERVSLSN